jgi:hypothetical protein
MDQNRNEHDDQHKFSFAFSVIFFEKVFQFARSSFNRGWRKTFGVRRSLLARDVTASHVDCLDSDVGV